MIQEAINTLSNLLNQFKDTNTLEIFSDGSVIFSYFENEDDGKRKEVNFDTAQELLEWTEQNLEKA